MKPFSALLLATVVATCSLSARAQAPEDFPPLADVTKGFDLIASSDQQNPKGLFNVWKREKDAQLLCEIPKQFQGKRYFIALTVSSGDRYAGLQSGEWVIEWRRYDKRLALLAPNLSVRADGEPEAKASVKRLFTDQVLMDIPILAIGPTGGPVIDLDQLLISNASKFFGPSVRITNPQLNEFLMAPLARESGGSGVCGQPVFASKADPDYQAILRTFEPVLAELRVRPRMDMAGAQPAAVDRNCLGNLE